MHKKKNVSIDPNSSKPERERERYQEVKSLVDWAITKAKRAEIRG